MVQLRLIHEHRTLTSQTIQSSGLQCMPIKTSWKGDCYSYIYNDAGLVISVPFRGALEISWVEGPEEKGE